jgi:hypothetical protein
MASSYRGDKSVDYTNTNPDYWSSVNQYFKENKSNEQGETGIWIPNLEKQGAEATALAASAGGVKAVGGSNYAGGSKSAGDRNYFLRGVDTGKKENERAEYRRERPIKMASIYRGGTEYTRTDSGDNFGGGTKLGRMGTLPENFQGRYLLGGQVTDRARGANYTDAGGDFTDRLAPGTSLDNTFLDSLLGPRDSDGLRGPYDPTRGIDSTLTSHTDGPRYASDGSQSEMGLPGWLAPAMGSVGPNNAAVTYLNEMVQTNSPIFKSLQTKALQVANRMGIPLRSSMAQGLVMKALMDGIGPYAEQAANVFNQQQFANQGYDNATRTFLNTAYANELTQRLGLTFQWYTNQANNDMNMWKTLLNATYGTVNNPNMSADSANWALGHINRFYKPGGLNTQQRPGGLLNWGSS